MNATTRKLTHAVLAPVAALGLAACGGAVGTVEITTYGEDFIEKEIPTKVGDGEGFVDGATVRYSKFLMALSQITIADQAGEVASEITEQRIFDLQQPGPHVVGSLEALGQRWDRVGIDIVPAAGAVAGNATAADVTLMNDGHYSIYAAGTVETGTVTYTFAWEFNTSTRYLDCQDGSAQLGVLVPSGGSTTMEYTMHGDHLFYDDLQSETPSLRFDAMAAADANDDKEITLAELADVRLSDLPAGQYGTGGASNVANLSEFVSALTRTITHFQGEGHCDTVVLGAR